MMSRKVTRFLSAIVMAGLMFSAAEANTVYVIEDMDSYPEWTFGAYMVSGNQLNLGSKKTAPNRGGGPVGLAVSEAKNRVFVSYEFSGALDVFYANTLEPYSTPQIVLPGANNAAGIVGSEARDRLYAIDRGNTQVYVYDFDTNAITAEQFNVRKGAIGITVWGNKLYVTYGDSEIDIYDLDNPGTLLDTLITTAAGGRMAIAVDGSDENNVLVYTTNTSQGPVNSSILSQYNVNTDVEVTLDLGRDGRGVSVLPSLGLVYVAVGDNSDSVAPEIRVYDSALTGMIDSDPLVVGKGPTDVVAGEGIIFLPEGTVAVPTLSEWAAIAMIVLLGGSAFIAIRRRTLI